MAFWVFLGSFGAAALVIGLIWSSLRKRVRSFSRRVFGTGNILSALQDIDTAAEETPRSLNGCDRLLLPNIRRDFPDFDEILMKTYAKEALKKRFGSHEGFTVHNVVIAQYLPTNLQKTVVLQAAVAWREDGRLQQKRFILHYTYMIQSSNPSVAANCPNCGGAIPYGATQCPFCDSRVANVMGSTWQFTEIREG